jgi:nicotinate-nucleotide adenylyltransferase
VKRIGIFGGSFDPVHNGHIESVQSFLNSGLIDEVWVLLTPDPPHKSGRMMAPFSDRIQMLHLAFGDHKDVTISDVEKSLPSPSYSLQTVRHLKNHYPGFTFFLCLGGDSLAEFHTWYRYREILKECSLMAVLRPGFSREGISNEILEKTVFVDHKPVRASSTQVRKDAAASDQILPAQVKEYIEKHQLYRAQ